MEKLKLPAVRGTGFAGVFCVAICILFFSAAGNLETAVASGTGAPAGLTQEFENGSRSPLSASKEELEAFLDNLFAEEMARLHLPGAVIALVREDEIYLAKGYGLSLIHI